MKLRRYILIEILYIGFLVLLCVTNNFAYHLEQTRSEPYTINTDGCQIPLFPLVSESIRDLVAQPVAQPQCNHSYPLVESNHTHLIVMKAAFNRYAVFGESKFYCCYRNYSVDGHLPNVAYGSCREFTSKIKAAHEFVRVECYYAGDKVYEDIFRFNIHKKLYPKRDLNSFSVVMFGLDGVSRQNFMRTMGRTAFFLKSRASIQLNGYNKLGENSFPNLFPMFTGKSYEDVKDSCFRYKVLDAQACQFLWDIYKTAGYHTALGSDSQVGVLGVYEPMLRYPPTDYYMQPFLYETQKIFKDRTVDYSMCSRSGFIYKELLRFAEDVFDNVRLGKLFAFFWEESITHGHLKYAHLLDDDYFKILTSLENRGHLEDTVVIFFSDHGTRFGDILSTEQGRQESRLPLFEVMFPLRFRRRYKLAYKNFQTNSHMLTSANDVFQTLLDIANPALLEDDQIKERTNTMNMESKGISLFLPVPSNRTCKTIGIEEHWCACTPGESKPVNLRGQTVTTKFVLNHVNQILSEYPECYKLKLSKIVDVMETSIKKKKRLRIIMETAPGGALLEATLVKKHKMWTLSGSVSRLNSYGDQSDCIKDPLAKNYCYCKKIVKISYPKSLIHSKINK